MQNSEARLKALEAKIENVLYENIHSVRGDVAGVDDALSLILQALKTELEDRIKELELPADDDRSYAKGFTQGYSEGWDDGERNNG